MDSIISRRRMCLFDFCGKNIETTVTAEALIADHWVKNIPILSNHHDKRGGGKLIVVGFDCKFKNPHPIKSMSSNISTLTLCVDTKCLILQLLYMDNIPESIKNILSDQHITFVGVEINENLNKLWSEFKLNCHKKVDIRTLVKIWFPLSYRQQELLSLKAMAFTVAGLSMRKRQSSKDYCDWDSRILCDELAQYASIDAYACYEVAHKLLKNNRVCKM